MPLNLIFWWTLRSEVMAKAGKCGVGCTLAANSPAQFTSDPRGLEWPPAERSMFAQHVCIPHFASLRRLKSMLETHTEAFPPIDARRPFGRGAKVASYVTRSDFTAVRGLMYEGWNGQC